eukprot:2349633-Rhodomonas_salina.4
MESAIAGPATNTFTFCFLYAFEKVIPGAGAMRFIEFHLASGLGSSQAEDEEDDETEWNTQQPQERHGPQCFLPATTHISVRVYVESLAQRRVYAA